MDGSTSLSALLDRLDDKIDKEGLDVLNPGRLLFVVTSSLSPLAARGRARAHTTVSDDTRDRVSKRCGNDCVRSSAL